MNICMSFKSYFRNIICSVMFVIEWKSVNEATFGFEENISLDSN